MGNKASTITVPANTRIYVIGPSSSGKTTLCGALAQKLQLVKDYSYITEVARRVIKEHGYTRDDIHVLKMQEDIMNAQIQCEKSTRDRYPIQVVDRSGLDPIVYAILTGTNVDDSQRRRESLEASAMFQQVLVQYRKPSSVFILLTPVEEWLVDDGVRHLDDQKRTVDIFRDVLSRLNIPYIEIGPEEKDLEKRVTVVLKAAKLED